MIQLWKPALCKGSAWAFLYHYQNQRSKIGDFDDLSSPPGGRLAQGVVKK